MILNLLDFYSTVNRLNINIIYSGPIWADGIEGIGETLKKRLKLDSLSLSVSQSVFSVFVEQMNTVLESSNNIKEEENSSGNLNNSSGLLILGIHDRTYFTQSGIVINNSRTTNIINEIDYINALDKQELRKYFKDQLKSDSINIRGITNRLRLIEIAKRATSKIEYCVEPYSQNCSFFSMYVEIGQGRI